MPSIPPEKLQRLSEEFEAFCYNRHLKGAKEYGDTKSLKVDTVEYALEELADLANYARYLYIKLRILEEDLRERGIDLSASVVEEVRDEDQVPPGAARFVPSSKVSRFLPGQS